MSVPSLSFGLGLLFLPLCEKELRKHFMAFSRPYFSPDVMVKLTRKVRG